jgi:hypothetical protein
MSDLRAKLAEARRHIETIEEQIALQGSLVAKTSRDDTDSAEQTSVLTELQRELLHMKKLVVLLENKISRGEA